MFYTYILLCDNGSYYKGFTNNLKNRYQQHLNGTGAKHTAKHKPVKIAYYETFETEQEAVAREKYFKSGSGREWLNTKIELLANRELEVGSVVANFATTANDGKLLHKGGTHE